MPTSDPEVPPETVRVAICDDHPAILMAMSELMEASEGEPRLTVVGTHQTPESLLAAWEPGTVDVLVLDMALGTPPDPRTGPELAARLMEADPNLRVLMYSGTVEPNAVRGALERGASGFLVKSVPPPELMAGVRRVAAGESPVLDANTATSLAVAMMQGEDQPALSPREREVIGLVAAGHTNARIGAQLNISENTVKSLLKRALDKLDAGDRASGVAEAFRRGLLR